MCWNTTSLRTAATGRQAALKLFSCPVDGQALGALTISRRARVGFVRAVQPVADWPSADADAPSDVSGAEFVADVKECGEDQAAL